MTVKVKVKFLLESAVICMYTSRCFLFVTVSHTLLTSESDHVSERLHHHKIPISSLMEFI